VVVAVAVVVVVVVVVVHQAILATVTVTRCLLSTNIRNHATNPAQPGTARVANALRLVTSSVA
jgi:hypothetical protein